MGQRASPVSADSCYRPSHIPRPQKSQPPGTGEWRALLVRNGKTGGNASRWAPPPSRLSACALADAPVNLLPAAPAPLRLPLPSSPLPAALLAASPGVRPLSPVRASAGAGPGELAEGEDWTVPSRASLRWATGPQPLRQQHHLSRVRRRLRQASARLRRPGGSAPAGERAPAFSRAPGEPGADPPRPLLTDGGEAG